MVDATELDRLEAAAWTDLFAACPSQVARALGLRVAAGAGWTALCAPGVDHIFLNRAFGVTEASLDEVLGVFREAGVPRFMLHLAPGLAGWRDEERGLQAFHRPWVKLVGPARPASEAPPVPVRPAVAEDADRLGRLFCAGFDVPEPAAPIFGGAIGRQGWDVLVAVDEGTVIAAGTLYRAGALGYLSGAVTDPAFRRRGAQRALLAQRIGRAHAAGVTTVCSETGEAVPGQPNPSQHNLERAGLAVVGVRHHLVPIGTSW